jgi:endonuclease/exonuclease/phosphatase family metal-dependent hydrolase
VRARAAGVMMLSMRVATLNLWCRHGDWPARRSVLADGFRELRPDLVAFQESIVTDDYDQITDLLGDGYEIHHGGARTPHDGAGTTIASRWPVTKLHERDLSVTARVDPAEPWIGRVYAAEIDGPEPLLFVNHKPSYPLHMELERELQAAATARLVEDLLGNGPRHVVLAGDFDATPDAASIRFWSGKQSLQGMSVCYRDAWEQAHPGEPGHTFTTRNPLMGWDWDRRIDYIFVRCEAKGPTLRVDRCERLFAEPVGGVWASDHFGLVADLSFRPSRT